MASPERTAPRPGFRRAAAFLLLTLGLLAVALVAAGGDGLLLRALPFADPGRLVLLQGTYTEKGVVSPFSLSQLDFADWRRQNRVFTGASVFAGLAFNLERGERSERLWGELVDDSYFPLLGLKPALGRSFLPEENARPMERFVVVLGHDLWRRAFGGDPGIVGRTVRLNQGLYQVVGVAPPGFRGLSDQADLWVPAMLPPNRDFLRIRRERWVPAGVARLKPGVTLGQAQADLDRITAGLARQFPDMNQGMGGTVTPLRDSWTGPLRHGLALLALGAGLLFLFAVFDARLLLAGERRTSAGNFLLSLLAAVFALLLARWAAPALLAASGLALPSFLSSTPGPAVLAATLALAVLASLALGRSPAEDGPAGSAGGGGRWLRIAVVVIQVTLALFLLVDAGITGWRFRQTTGQDLGFRPAGLLSFRLDLKGPQYASDPLVANLLRERYYPRIAAVPGVQQLALSDPAIPTDGLVGGYITIEDHASAAPDGTYVAMWHSVSPGYFETLGIPLLAGRSFNVKDKDTFAVIVSKSLADQQWPGQNPLGKRLKEDTRTNLGEPWMTVVGVVGEARHEGIYADPAPPTGDIYLSVFQFPLRLPLTINFLVRPEPGVALSQLRPALQREMRAIDPELPAYDMATLEERLAKQAQKARFEVLLLGLLAALVAIEAAAGLYGLLKAR